MHAYILHTYMATPLHFVSGLVTFKDAHHDVVCGLEQIFDTPCAMEYKEGWRERKTLFSKVKLTRHKIRKASGGMISE